MGGILVMHFSAEDEFDISIVMPCLNEESTVGICIDEAFTYIRNKGLKGEVIVSDNKSTDSSCKVAKEHGAKIVNVNERGYGNAIIGGLKACSGRVIIIGDCDTTYDFSNLDRFYHPLSIGKYDMVIGDRFAGGIEKGAMPLSHKLGVRFLSACARLKFKTDVHDFHSGLRGLTREATKQLDFKCGGMEFATEMIASASMKQLKVGQTPVKLRRCIYDRRSKLKTIRDGMRHLRYIIFDN